MGKRKKCNEGKYRKKNKGIRGREDKLMEKRRIAKRKRHWGSRNEASSVNGVLSAPSVKVTRN